MAPLDTKPPQAGRIIVVGGYGAVGREAATMLAGLLPRVQIVVAGRRPDTAQPLPGVTPMRMDAADEADTARSLVGADAVLVCAELDDARLARACVEREIHYVDVSASHRLLSRIEDLDELARDHDATAVLSVGLAPGVTNLLARGCVEAARVDPATTEVDIGVLLGTGDEHGAAAIGWTLVALAELGPGWSMAFPPPHGRRAVHRFPSSDQYTLPRTLGVGRVRTGLCLDSRTWTALMAVAARPSVGRTIARPAVRRAVAAALTKSHIGGDRFSVTAYTAGLRSSFSGRRQSRATGLAAALTARRLPALPPGVWHLDRSSTPTSSSPSSPPTDSTSNSPCPVCPGSSTLPTKTRSQPCPFT